MQVGDIDMNRQSARFQPMSHAVDNLARQKVCVIVSVDVDRRLTLIGSKSRTVPQRIGNTY